MVVHEKSLVDSLVNPGQEHSVRSHAQVVIDGDSGVVGFCCGVCCIQEVQVLKYLEAKAAIAVHRRQNQLLTGTTTLISYVPGYLGAASG
jgi:hypothetical protein